MFHGLVINGNLGTDQLYPWTLKSRAFSPIYNLIAHEELELLVSKVNTLHKMALSKKVEKDVGKLADPFIHFFRGQFFNKFTLEALERDESNPDKIHDKEFFAVIRKNNPIQKQDLKNYFSNLILVMEMMFGENWKVEKIQVVNLFNSYVEYWNKNQKFLEMEKVGIPD